MFNEVPERGQTETQTYKQRSINQTKNTFIPQKKDDKVTNHLTGIEQASHKNGQNKTTSLYKVTKMIGLVEATLGQTT